MWIILISYVTITLPGGGHLHSSASTLGHASCCCRQTGDLYDVEITGNFIECEGQENNDLELLEFFFLT